MGGLHGGGKRAQPRHRDCDSGRPPNEPADFIQIDLTKNGNEEKNIKSDAHHGRKPRGGRRLEDSAGLLRLAESESIHSASYAKMLGSRLGFELGRKYSSRQNNGERTLTMTRVE